MKSTKQIPKEVLSSIAENIQIEQAQTPKFRKGWKLKYNMD